jgi:hypothetical protein
MRTLSNMPSQQKRGWDAHGVQHIDEILGTTRQLCMAMLYEAKPDNEPRRHGHAAGIARGEIASLFART